MYGSKMVRAKMQKMKQNREDKNLMRDKERKIQLLQLKKEKKRLQESYDLEAELREEKKKILSLKYAKPVSMVKKVGGVLQGMGKRMKENQTERKESAFSMTGKSALDFGPVKTVNKNSPFDAKNIEMVQPKKDDSKRIIIIN